jgi:surfeit locus 1 family protein
LSAPAKATTRRSWLGLLIPAMLVFAVLIALGTWQIERKAWKEGLIAALTERLAAPPAALPPPATWPRLDPASDEYRRVTFTATFDHAKEALVYAAASSFRPDVAGGGPGYWIFAPARLPDGGFVIVNRGFVPEARKDAASRTAGQIAGPVEIVGVMRWPDARHWFSPADDPQHNMWFTRDPLAIAAAKALGPVAPFYVEQESPCRPVAYRSRASSWCNCATSTCNTR